MFESNKFSNLLMSRPRYDSVGVDIITANLRTAGMIRKEYFDLL